MTAGDLTAVVRMAVVRLRLAAGRIRGLRDAGAKDGRQLGTGDRISGGDRHRAHRASARSAGPPAAQPDRGPVAPRRLRVGSSPNLRHSSESCRRSCGS